MSEDDTKRRKEDALVQDYNTILRESSLLTTFAGILFGFLLEISINAPESFDISDRIVLLIALFSITVAISFFVMPVVYHICNTLTKTWRNSSKEVIDLLSLVYFLQSSRYS